MLATPDLSHAWNFRKATDAADSLTSFEILIGILFSHGSRRVQNIRKYNAYEIIWIYSTLVLIENRQQNAKLAELSLTHGLPFYAQHFPPVALEQLGEKVPAHRFVGNVP